MVKIKDSLIETQLKKERSDRNFLLIIAIMLSVILAVLMVNTYVIFNVYVFGPSMQPTLQTGDVLIANRLKEPERGDVVIVSGAKVGSKDWLVKRIIAVGGETVEIKDGYVFVEGEKLDFEPYVLKNGVTQPASERPSTFTVGENEFFYLGDNRENSSDSRNYGVCSKEQIVGVVSEWSLSNKKSITRFYNFISKFRLGR